MTPLTQELTHLLGARVPLLNLITYEEDRVVEALTEIKGGERLGIVAWDLADGFQTIRAASQQFPVKECTTDTVLQHIADKSPPEHIFVLKDFHHAWTQKRAYVTRKLRNMAPRLRAQNQFLIFVTPVLDLPVELKDDVVVLHVPLPDRDALEKLFETVTGKLDRRKLPRPEIRERLVSAALGLTTNKARLAYSRVAATFDAFDERGIEQVTWFKQQVIKESGALEFWPAGTAEEDVGGLELLKAWLKKREAGFGREARAQGVPYPRGVILIGIPGTGKSLSAKMLSSLWKLPLLRLDVGALFGSLLGQSEENLRRAVQLAETVSPCILWIDELEKAFGGSGSLDGGAARRVFGTFLTWMQEHATPVFVLATANDVAGLAPELMGRFDGTFFLDLPSDSERRDIWRIHLKRAGLEFPDRRSGFGELVEQSRGYVGREIERAVREAQFTALADGNREITHDDLLAAIGQVVPLSASHAQSIEELRRWKHDGRALPASREPEVPPASGRRTFDV